MPLIRYLCPCQDNESTDILDVLWNPVALHCLEELYYCDVCEAIRCDRCVDDEVVCRYCPSCLFEVTTAAAKTDNSQCMRSCFQCPLCMCALSVKTSQVDQVAQYTLHCTYCQYVSALKFDKSMALARQLNREKRQKVHLRYSELQAYYREQAVNDLTHKQASSRDYQSLIKERSPKILSAIPREKSEKDVLYPIPRQLIGKSAKRCRNCRTTIIKPEPKPASIKFKTKLLAINYIVQFCLSPHSPTTFEKMKTNETYIFRLTITNPLDHSIKIRLATKSKHRVTLITPTFELGPAPELWDEVSLIRSVPSDQIARQTPASNKVLMEGMREKNISGFYERGQNWATVLMEIVSTGESDMCVGLFTHVSYELMVEDEAKKRGTAFWTLLDMRELS